MRDSVDSNAVQRPLPVSNHACPRGRCSTHKSPLAPLSHPPPNPQVFHCRWAMLGAAGMIAPEALAAWGVTPSVTGIPWFKTGVIPPAGSEFSYWTDNYTLFYLEAIAMNFAELKRLQDYK